MPTGGRITGGITGVTAPELSDFEQLKRRIIVAKNGIRVFIIKYVIFTQSRRDAKVLFFLLKFLCVSATLRENTLYMNLKL
jgi:hypothetical protein